MKCVVDASVAAKWFVEEELTDAALRLWDRFPEFHAPDFLEIEMASIGWKKGPAR